MSWEYSKYKAHCESCGREGFCIRGSDDWNRTSTSWEGFGSKEADPTAAARKRSDRRDSVALCECGSSNVKVGEHIGDC